jgi:hypothetical protein
MMNIRRVLWSWFGAYLVALSAVILQPSTPAQYLGRYSTTSFVILLLLLVGLLPAYLTIRWLMAQVETRQGLPLLHGLSLIGIGGALLVGWSVNLGPTTSYLVIRLLLTYVLLSIAVWHLLNLRLPGWLTVMLLLLTTASVAVVYWLATDYPGLLWTDEGFMASAARGVIETGRPEVTYLQPALREAYSSLYAGLSLWYELFGAGFSSGRLFILTVGMTSLGILGLALHRLYAPAVVWLTLLVGVISLLNLNYMRQDTGVALWLSLAILCYVLAEQHKKQWLHGLVGLFLGLSLDGHPVAYRLSIGFGLAYLLEAGLIWRDERQIDRRVLYLLAGGLAGVATYYAVYSIWTPTIRDFTGSSPFFFTGWQGFSLAGRHLFDMLHLVPLAFGGAIIGMVLMSTRRQRIDRLLLTVIISSVLILSFLYMPLRTHYVYHMLPLLLMALATGLSIVWESLPETRRAGILRGLGVLVALAASGLVIQGLRSEDSQSYDPARQIATEVRSIVTDDDIIVAPDPMFFVFYDHPNFYEITAGNAVSRQQDITARAFWQQLAPNVIVFVRGYPLSYPQGLRDYIDAQSFGIVRCWTYPVTGRVDMLVRDAPANNDVMCQRLSN